MLKFIFTMFLLTNLAQAKPLDLKKNNRSILIEEVSKWTLGKDLFGMPFIYFSPQENGQRSNISFTDTGVQLALDMKALSSNKKDYEDGRKKWAESISASVLSFRPYELVVNSRGHKVHRIGFSYLHEGKKYDERSYYIECRGRIIYSKSLRLVENELHDKDFSNLISTLDCAGI